jgi:hypothetical protein
VGIQILEMSRDWMSASRVSREYADGVENFIRFALDHNGNRQTLFCPCVDCANVEKLRVSEVKDHLFRNGIDVNYTRWIWHGEEDHVPPTSADFVPNDEFEFDRIDDMLHAVEDNVHDNPEIYEELVVDAEKPLYDGCTKFTKLSAVLKLYNLKAGNGWTDKSFTSLLELFSDMLPSQNTLPRRTYDAKKVLCSMGLNYEKIHACPNDCILYRGEHAILEKCPNPACNASRYKQGKIPAKVLRYFPIIPRFKRLFGCEEDARNLTWHYDCRSRDGKLRHPADSPQWKMIDSKFPEFGREKRNLRIALCTDGMNPFSGLSTSYSTWPVLLALYNLPPSLCMKRKYLMLSLLISGPKQPGADIDVFLSPLIDDLKFLWDEGVDVHDAQQGESFRMRAMLFCTVNDFPAYGNLSAYTVRGHYACPICEENTSFCQLPHSGKPVYLGHRRFLPSSHPYRSQKKAFNGRNEKGRAPPTLTGEQLFEKLADKEVAYGKPNKKHLPTSGWKRRSVFFDLPYWKFLFVRHSLDVMHIEKNVCDSLIGTLLNMPGKTKDGVKSREDLRKLGIRTELAPITKGNRTFLPPASYTLSRREKVEMCEFLRGVKVPEGHCSNLRSLVSMNDLKLVGMKSHDCHILMQQLLPVAIRGILPKRVRHVIIRLCQFFNAICNKVIDPEHLDSLQKEIVLILCQLEMYFPPSFFDIMIHLTVHLVDEVKFCGPIFLRWMYPFERHMKVLKGYVKNAYRPEGCIAERYIAEEAAEFCSNYLAGVDVIGLPRPKHVDPLIGEGISGQKVITISRSTREKAHLYVLLNDPDVEPYMEQHLDDLRVNNVGKGERWIVQEHSRSFVSWFRTRIGNLLSSSRESIPERLRWLSYGPSTEVFAYTGYRMNGCTFYTKEYDRKRVNQNSGVTLLAQAMHVASAKDKNPIYADMQYYGVIRDIWVLNYEHFLVPIFSCDWVDNNSGLKIDEYGAILVDLNKLGHKDDPFILARQAQQVFYVKDPSDMRWSVVLSGKKTNPEEEEEVHDIVCECPLSIPPFTVDDADNQLYLRDDHDEGDWIEEPATSQKRKSQKRKRRWIHHFF